MTALARGANAAPPGAVTALRVIGARITGQLDLADAEIGHLLRFEGCWFEEGPSLRGAATRTIGIVGCQVPGIDATLASVEGTLDLRRSVLHGRLSLMRARIAGELQLGGAVLSDPEGWALFAGGLVMEGGVFCRRGFTAHGGSGYWGPTCPAACSWRAPGWTIPTALRSSRTTPWPRPWSSRRASPPPGPCSCAARRYPTNSPSTAPS
ncbi:hypothetical protein ACRAWF_01675 [Streptomyces sp. L7]